MPNQRTAKGVVRLASFIIEHFEDEPSNEEEDPIDCAIRLLREHPKYIPDYLYVLAPTYEQYRYFCRLNELNPNNTHYIRERDGVWMLRGTRGQRIAYYGDYHNRKDYPEVARMIREREMVDVTGEYKHG